MKIILPIFSSNDLTEYFMSFDFKIWNNFWSYSELEYIIIGY